MAIAKGSREAFGGPGIEPRWTHSELNCRKAIQSDSRSGQAYYWLVLWEVLAPAHAAERLQNFWQRF